MTTECLLMPPPVGATRRRPPPTSCLVAGGDLRAMGRRWTDTARNCRDDSQTNLARSPPPLISEGLSCALRRLPSLAGHSGSRLEPRCEREVRENLAERVTPLLPFARSSLATSTDLGGASTRRA